MPLKSSPLRILKHEFLRIELNTSEKEGAEKRLPLAAQRSGGPANDNPRRYRLFLTVRYGENGKTLYWGEIGVVGYFEVAREYPEEKMRDLVFVTGASILYGACREMLANLTARSKGGMITLPSVSFSSAGLVPEEPEAASPRRAPVQAGGRLSRTGKRGDQSRTASGKNPA